MAFDPVSDDNPVFPCLCGHPITTHGTETDFNRRWDWNDDHTEEVEIVDEYPVPFCYACEHDCYFVEMSNLEYLELKAHGNDQR